VLLFTPSPFSGGPPKPSSSERQHWGFAAAPPADSAHLQGEALISSCVAGAIVVFMIFVFHFLFRKLCQKPQETETGAAAERPLINERSNPGQHLDGGETPSASLTRN
jgi:hypothetical protein